MCEAPVFYATTDGQTQRIAEALSASLRHHGLESRAIDVASADARTFRWDRTRAVMLGASLHAGRHQSAAAAFVRAHLAALNARPSVFFSVSLSICSSIPDDVAAAKRIAQAFPDDLGWRPLRVVSVGGRLAYTRYGWLKRRMMRSIARRAGGPTDTSRDHELTNWDEVRATAAALAASLQPRAAAAASA